VEESAGEGGTEMAVALGENAGDLRRGERRGESESDLGGRRREGE
jgi:hypothetical protein